MNPSPSFPSPLYIPIEVPLLDEDFETFGCVETDDLPFTEEFRRNERN